MVGRGTIAAEYNGHSHSQGRYVEDGHDTTTPHNGDPYRTDDDPPDPDPEEPLVTRSRPAKHEMGEREDGDELDIVARANSAAESESSFRLKQTAIKQQHYYTQNIGDRDVDVISGGGVGGGGGVKFKDGTGGAQRDDDNDDDDTVFQNGGSVLVCHALNKPKSAQRRRRRSRSETSSGKERPSTTGGGGGGGRKGGGSGSRVGSSNSSKRRASSVMSNGRRGSILSTLSVNGDGGGDGGDEILAEAAKKMTLTERRLAMDRERYSAKNLFNVVRSNSSLYYSGEFAGDGKTDTSPDGLRKAGGTGMGKTSPTGRPVTAPGGTMTRRRRVGFLRPTTASASRLSRFSDPIFSPADAASEGFEVDGYGRPHRRLPRSRKELEKLARLNIDPFERAVNQAEMAREREEERLANEGKDAVQQDLLHKLKGGRPQLQARVSSFLKNIDEFNKVRGSRKSALDQILEAS